MTTKIRPFRFDVVGSFLRPEELKKARVKFAQGEIRAEALREIEDKAILDLLEKQHAAGLKTATDGEYRRSFWHLDFFWGLAGVARKPLDVGVDFTGTELRPETARITGKISGENHPFVEDFKFVYENAPEGMTPKQTIPAPAQFVQESLRPGNIEHTRKIYESDEELVADVAAAYRKVIQELYDAGCRVIQFDDCTWGRLIGGKGYDHDYSDSEIEELKALYLDVNNRAIAEAPADLAINTHVCRGNYKSTYFASGPYTSVADTLFAREEVDAFFLEYDSDRAGGFEPLKEVPAEKQVVLGLVTSKSSELENRDVIIERIKEASQYIPLENLYLSPQCGFSSTEEGNTLTEEDQWAKIQLIKEIAEEVWPGA